MMIFVLYLTPIPGNTLAQLGMNFHAYEQKISYVLIHMRSDTCAT